MITNFTYTGHPQFYRPGLQPTLWASSGQVAALQHIQLTRTRLSTIAMPAGFYDLVEVSVKTLSGNADMTIGMTMDLEKGAVHTLSGDADMIITMGMDLEKGLRHDLAGDADMTIGMTMGLEEKVPLTLAGNADMTIGMSMDLNASKPLAGNADMAIGMSMDLDPSLRAEGRPLIVRPERRSLIVRPHVAQLENPSAITRIDGETVTHPVKWTAYLEGRTLVSVTYEANPSGFGTIEDVGFNSDKTWAYMRLKPTQPGRFVVTSTATLSDGDHPKLKIPVVVERDDA